MGKCEQGLDRSFLFLARQHEVRFRPQCMLAVALLFTVTLGPMRCARAAGTVVSLSGTDWLINGNSINAGTPCEGLLMNDPSPPW